MLSCRWQSGNQWPNGRSFPLPPQRDRSGFGQIAICNASKPGAKLHGEDGWKSDFVCYGRLLKKASGHGRPY
jgi:hypothetical protein